LFTLTFSSDKECKLCGTIWRPAWPRYGGILAVIVGSITGLGGIAFLIMVLTPTHWTGKPPSDWAVFRAIAEGILLVVVGAAFVSLGIAVMKGKMGKQTIVKPGKEQGNG
jgi:hypothetical protein